MTPDPRPSDDLRWMAFRHLAGELDVADRLAFEGRLADDPEACEAFAEVVGLLVAVVRVEPIPSRRRPRSIRFAAVGLAVAATVLAAILVGRSGRPAAEGPTVAVAEDSIPLERAWSALRREVSGPAIDGEDPEDWESSDLASADDESDQGSEPPTWLVAAVVLSEETLGSASAPLEN